MIKARIILLICYLDPPSVGFERSLLPSVSSELVDNFGHLFYGTRPRQTYVFPLFKIWILPLRRSPVHSDLLMATFAKCGYSSVPKWSDCQILRHGRDENGNRVWASIFQQMLPNKAHTYAATRCVFLLITKMCITSIYVYLNKEKNTYIRNAILFLTHIVKPPHDSLCVRIYILFKKRFASTRESAYIPGRSSYFDSVISCCSCYKISS